MIRFAVMFMTVSLSLAYILNVGDVLTVDVYFHTGGVISKTTVVDMEGFASLPYVGYVPVKGKDVESIREIIQEKVDEFLPSAVVVVYVSKPHPEYVYFHGIVNGVYDLSSLPEKNRRLSKVMAMMLKGSKTFPKEVKVIRDGRIMEVDLDEFLETGDEKYDPILKDGDIVYTPSPEYAGVFGDMVTPGVYEIKEDESLLQLLTEAKLRGDPNEISSVEVFRGGKKTVFNGFDVENLGRFTVRGGDMVLVKSYGKIAVYVLGDISRKIILSEREDHDLRSVLSGLGLTFSGSEKWHLKLVRGDGAKDFEFKGPSDIPRIDLEDGDLIVVKRIPEYVTLQGVVSGRFDLSSLPEDERKLSSVLASLSVDSKVRKVRISRKDGELIVEKRNGMWEEDPELKPGDEIYTYGPAEVVVYGDAVRSGLYTIESGESVLDVLAKAGADLKGQVKSVKLIRGDEEIVLNPNDPNAMRKTILRDGDLVEVVGHGEINVFLSGILSRKMVFSEKEKPNLREVLSTAGLTFKEGSVYRIEVFSGGKSKEYTVRSPSDIPAIPIEDGDMISIGIVNPPRVYVSGYGVLEFRGEDATLRKLLYRVGLKRGIAFVTRESSTTWFRVEDVMLGKENFELRDGDYVYLAEYPFGKVSVVHGRTVTVGLEEPEEDLKDVLLKSGLMGSPDDVESVGILRDGSELEMDVEDVLSGRVEFSVKDGDVVVLKPKKGKVLYVGGDLGAVLTFSADEEMNEDVILAKLGISKDSVEELKGDFVDGGIVTIKLKRETNVYVYGDVVRSSVVSFKSSESRNLRSLLGKIGIAFPSRDTGYTLSIFRDGEEVFEKEISPAIDPSVLDFELRDGDFVRININVIEVDVLGVGVRQGRYSLPKGSKLLDLLMKMGGIPSGSENVKIIRKGKVREVVLKKNDVPDFELRDGDILVFEELPEDFAYIFGDVSKPGTIYVGEGEKLVKVLSLTGGLSGWESKRKVKIIRKDGKEEDLNLDHESLLKVKVYGGDVVYVVPRAFNRVYVLGAVLRPSIVPVDRETTLLDAIMRAGGFSKGAVKDRVYVFRGGVKGPIEVYDMSWVMGKNGGNNPKLQPGDIVYVPDNPMITINEMISLITPMMSFINNSINLYENIKELW